MRDKTVYNFRIYLVNDPRNRRFVVSEKLERELRSEYRAFELLATKSCTKKEVYHYVKQLRKLYRVPECDYCFYVPRIEKYTFYNQPEHVQQRIREQASSRSKGKKLSEIHKKRISEKMKSLGLKRPHLANYRFKQGRKGYRFYWIHNEDTGKELQIGIDKPIPEGWKRGRPSMYEQVNKHKLSYLNTLLT